VLLALLVGTRRLLVVRATIGRCSTIEWLQSAFFALFILGKPDGVVRG
jgi:hypothetical protein